jgi:hypothetical protein
MSQYHDDITWLGLYGSMESIAVMQVSRCAPKHHEIVSALVKLDRAGRDVRPAEQEGFVMVDGRTMSFDSFRRNYRRIP